MESPAPSPLVASAITTSPPSAKKRKSVKIFNKPKNFTLFTDVTNTPKSPNIHLSSTPPKSASKTPATPASASATKMSKSQMIHHIAQLEAELQASKQKSTDLKLDLARTSSTMDQLLKSNSALTAQVEDLETENTKLKKELDGYITKKWKDFCAMQESPTPSRKRAYSSVEQE